MAERPPRLAEWLVRWATARTPWANSLAGDLNERPHYWRNALSIAWHFAPQRLSAPELRYEIRHAWRALRRSPVYTAVVVFTLALGIGATATIVGLIDTMFVRKLPVPRPEQIVAVYSSDARSRRFDATSAWSPFDEFERLRHAMPGAGDLASYSMASLDAGDALAGQPTWTALVSGNYFDVLGVRPQLGRFIRPDEEVANGIRGVAVIGDHVWRTSYASDPTVLGRAIPIGKGSFTIVGVAPPHFTGMHPEGRTDLWIPYTMARVARGAARDSSAFTGSDHVAMFGRLRAGATLAEVQASADREAASLAAAQPKAYAHLKLTARVRDRLTTYELSPAALQSGVVIWLVVAMLQLMICTNVASLMLARAAAKRAETGVRLCLGASRARIMLSSLAESAMLALLGGAGGLLLARWLTTLVATMQFMSASDAGFDGRAVAIAALIAGLSVLQFGVLPALDLSNNDPLDVVRGIAGSGKRRNNRAELAVMVQIALSVTLLVTAAAFSSLYLRQRERAPGYDVDQVVVASIAKGDYDDALAALGTVHEIDGVATAVGAPLHDTRWYGEVSVAGRPTAAEPQRASLQAIGPGYFRVLGATILRGREFLPTDRSAKPADRFDVAVINESMARKLWPGEDPLGKVLVVAASPAVTVVGVVRDMSDVSTVSPVPRAYVPLLEADRRTFDLVLHVRGDARDAAMHIADALGRSPTLRRPPVQTLASIREDILTVSRAATRGLTATSGVALLLACVGLYGLIAMWVAQRRRELGIRLALGATAGAAHRLVLAASAKVMAVGALLGIAMGAALVQVERSWIGPSLSIDVRIGLGMIACLSAVMLSAVYVATKRGTRGAITDLMR